MFAAIKAFLIALPRVMDLVETVLRGIQNYVQVLHDNALRERERAASQKAVETKDTSDLEKIFRGGTSQ